MALEFKVIHRTDIRFQEINILMILDNKYFYVLINFTF